MLNQDLEKLRCPGLAPQNKAGFPANGMQAQALAQLVTHIPNEANPPEAEFAIMAITQIRPVVYAKKPAPLRQSRP